MSPSASPDLVDHFLVARVEARVTGANAHDAHAMLAKYFCLCEIAAADEAQRPRVEAAEKGLRAFCQDAGRARAIRESLCDLSPLPPPAPPPCAGPAR